MDLIPTSLASTPPSRFIKANFSLTLLSMSLIGLLIFFSRSSIGLLIFDCSEPAFAEVEKMNTFLPNFIGASEGGRAWVWSVFAGFKKDYTFYKKVKGNVQVLYNLYDDHDNSPYVDRLNVRMGWEFPMKKKITDNREQITDNR